MVHHNMQDTELQDNKEIPDIGDNRNKTSRSDSDSKVSHCDSDSKVNTEVPSCDTEVPSSDNKAPSCDNKAPSSDNKVPSYDTEVPSSDNTIPPGDVHSPRLFTDKQLLGTTVRTKITVESAIFKVFYLVGESDERLLKAVRTLSGFEIYKCDGMGLLSKMKANIFGTRYSHQRLRPEGSTCATGLDAVSSLDIQYETSFLEKGKPRSFKIKINELELINKKPLFNTETNSFSLNFSGRVTMPSVKNFQIIHPLDPTYITLTFGKEDRNSYILDFTYPWSILDAFCVGLSSLDHKFGSD